ncbi:unnamed protein product, partial [Cyprideis torosa]
MALQVGTVEGRSSNRRIEVSRLRRLRRANPANVHRLALQKEGMVGFDFHRAGIEAMRARMRAVRRNGAKVHPVLTKKATSKLYSQTAERRGVEKRETSGEDRSSDRPPSLVEESDDDVIFQDSEPGQDSDEQDESSNEDESSKSSSPSQEGSDDGIAFEETEETGRNDQNQ